MEYFIFVIHNTLINKRKCNKLNRSWKLGYTYTAVKDGNIWIFFICLEFKKSKEINLKIFKKNNLVLVFILLFNSKVFFFLNLFIDIFSFDNFSFFFLFYLINF